MKLTPSQVDGLGAILFAAPANRYLTISIIPTYLCLAPTHHWTSVGTPRLDRVTGSTEYVALTAAIAGLLQIARSPTPQCSVDSVR